MKRVQVKTAKAQVADKDIISMFNKMLGTEDADPSIIMPKYESIKGKVHTISKILTAATNDVIKKSFPSEGENCDEILKFTNSLDAIEFVNFPPLYNMTDDDVKKICKSYTSLKLNNDIKIIIMTCKNLIEYDGKLEVSPEMFDDSFIARIPGFEFKPFPFSGFNIKNIWASPNMTDHIKKYIFTVLRIVLKMSRDIYKIVTSPDVDVKEFSKAIISSIAKVKKQIPRCDKAFNKIEQSVGLMVENFDGYYKDFVQSQNPGTIIEGFIVDVARSGNTDAQTTRQFKKIMLHYQKLTNGKIKDPKIKHVFDMLKSNFDTMEKNSGVDPGEDGEDEESQKIPDKPLTNSAKRKLKREQTEC